MKRLILLLTALFAFTTLVGCEVRVDNTPASPVEATSLPPPTPTNIQERVLRIGLVNEPSDLLPYHSTPADERISAPLTELLFPSPLLAVDFTMQTSGVLTRVPDFTNGDVVTTTVTVFRDELGQITDTPTEKTDEVTQISVTFRWNPDLRWSDGTPVTAADSVFAYELAQRVDLGQAANSRLAMIERYEQVDEHTTRAVLRPDVTDPAYLTSFWVPLPRHLLAEMDPQQVTQSEFARKPIGYGPYMIGAFESGALELVPNPHYVGPAAPFERIIVAFRKDPQQLVDLVRNGGLDLAFIEQPVPDLLAQLVQSAGQQELQLSTSPNTIWEHLDFNLDVPLLQDIRVRRAIAHAINRPQLVEQLLGGKSNVLESWILPGQLGYPPLDQITRYPYDPDQARRLLDEANLLDSDGDGWREHDGLPILLSLVTSANSPLRAAVANQIATDLAQVGLQVEVAQLPSTELYSAEGPLYQRTFQLALFGWIAGPHPRGWELWSCAGVPSEANNWTGNNFAGWCFFEANEAINTATTSLDPEEQKAAYLRQQQLFTQELPVLPLFQRIDALVARQGVAGWRLNPTAPFTWNMNEWRMEP
ncbi:peptide ABC transporter substrate-binding protein [Chloroflexus sp.]|uniref:peptide ABC transporter substrate-binding protein n=1 Tax=Chloroflexus sp. TaxID=1904827 RepID=UPI00298F1E18|nr:peptide ABC transporter substrate-binding protein [Chloroflexus sp.]MDW8405788.1 peptide ABC transporter substrate-binding protein [Chloroflexus sp.]